MSVIVPSYNERNNVPVLWSVLAKSSRDCLGGDRRRRRFADGTAGVVKDLSAPIRASVSAPGRPARPSAPASKASVVLRPVVAVRTPICSTTRPFCRRCSPRSMPVPTSSSGSRYVDGGTAGAGLSSFAAGAANGHLAAKSSEDHLQRSDERLLHDPPREGRGSRRQDRPRRLKILLDIVSSSPPMKTVEVPFTFRERLAGESKLDSLVTAEYLGLLVSKFSGACCRCAS